MKVEDFNYHLPEELIAQTPLKDRSASRLLVLDKNTGNISHDQFSNILDYLSKDDVLVLNNTSVIPARLYGIKEETNAAIEILLLKQKEEDIWECLVKKAKKIKLGTIISFGEGLIKAKCVKLGEDGIRELKMIYEGVFYEILDVLGEMPLPPYIHEKLENQDRYQTVYNKYKGSAAAPTAGLHFTKDLLKKISDKGVIITYVTLHVGLGTFRPVQVEDVTSHKMHTEYYEMDRETAKILNQAKVDKRKIIAVGTTSLRTLETVLRDYDNFIETSGWSDIFIYPGYKFKAIDELITNFHLPKSTLLMLVSALTSKEMIMNAYSEAIKEKYRFFSFGDSMIIKG
ncbi:S-adenosylmethionine:tRNA ribosyltransferase-isomerase [Candidatus Izimaplasma bacterium HR1]|jgi:S-adenosylmethionine:tRNA ribosyltransferase-isomerase|uniref:tRNA preQ1(34) S-adenosylmethionine ribosyltransferase-isomerase QueA n=1 Tax=Candidatus Izimoplasma sp. HR1 TaxID=1541959 RepID=UPI0004F65D4A|nr:S-adenosylmethionine:tRNA ribosyltransferase-isomerase [Candidatus Izimaplasma bacterium HR1]